MAKKCAICGKKIGFFATNLKFKDKQFICGDCIKKFDFSKNKDDVAPTTDAMNWAKDHNFADLRKYLSQDKTFKDIQNNSNNIRYEYDKLLTDFRNDESDSFSHFIFSDKRQQILEKKGLMRDPRVINYSDIVSYRVNQQGHDEKKHHGITRAVVGGVLAGGVGALVGATTGHKQTDYIDHLGLVVTLKDGSNFELVFIRKMDQLKSDSMTARGLIKQMNSWASWIDSVIAKNQNTKQKPKVDPADEIRKFKKLADDGIISNDEFEAKKKQLLGL